MRAGSAGAVPLVGFYFLYFGALGITLPFLPGYLRTLSLSATEVGVLLALQPSLALVAPLFWGNLADRTGRPDRVLSIVAVCAALAFAPLLLVERFAGIFAVLLVYAVFASSVTTLLDSIALHRVAERGGSYARIRLFGSLGFVASSAAFGWLGGFDRRVVLFAFVLMAAYAAWSFAVRIPPRFHEGERIPRRVLLRNRDLALFLVTACLHWIACAPFHGMFAVHVTELGLSAAVVGLSAGLGVIAEVGVMWTWPRFAGRVAPRHLLAVSYGASALRWAGMAVADSPGAIVALSLLHALSFGTFFIGGVAFVARRVPAARRASGQALFVSATFGLGGLLGMLSAGAGFDLVGGHKLFALAAVVELVAMGLITRIGPPADGAR